MMKLVAILLLIALLVMVISPLLDPAPVALRAARSAVRLFAAFAGLALLVGSRASLFVRNQRRARARAPAVKPLYLHAIPIADFDCVRLC
jgi:hypothetical protein